MKMIDALLILVFILALSAPLLISIGLAYLKKIKWQYFAFILAYFAIHYSKALTFLFPWADTSAEYGPILVGTTICVSLLIYIFGKLKSEEFLALVIMSMLNFFTPFFDYAIVLLCYLASKPAYSKKTIKNKLWLLNILLPLVLILLGAYWFRAGAVMYPVPLVYIGIVATAVLSSAYLALFRNVRANKITMWVSLLSMLPFIAGIFFIEPTGGAAGFEDALPSIGEIFSYYLAIVVLVLRIALSVICSEQVEA